MQSENYLIKVIKARRRVTPKTLLYFYLSTLGVDPWAPAVIKGSPTAGKCPVTGTEGLLYRAMSDGIAVELSLSAMIHYPGVNQMDLYMTILASEEEAPLKKRRGA